jgi:hypothetical protein
METKAYGILSFGKEDADTEDGTDPTLTVLDVELFSLENGRFRCRFGRQDGRGCHHQDGDSGPSQEAKLALNSL